MIKLLGTAMIVLGSGSAGFGFARAVRAQLRQLNTLLAALEAMKGEIEYRLTPLPELFAALGEGTEPVTAAFFLRLRGDDGSRPGAAAAACTGAGDGTDNESAMERADARDGAESGLFTREV